MLEEFRINFKRRITLFSGMTLIAAALGVCIFLFMNYSEEATMYDGSVMGFQSEQSYNSFV